MFIHELDEEEDMERDCWRWETLIVLWTAKKQDRRQELSSTHQGAVAAWKASTPVHAKKAAKTNHTGAQGPTSNKFAS